MVHKPTSTRSAAPHLISPVFYHMWPPHEIQFKYMQSRVWNKAESISWKSNIEALNCQSWWAVDVNCLCTCCSLKALRRLLVSATRRGKDRRGPAYESGTVICSYFACLPSSVQGSTTESKRWEIKSVNRCQLKKKKKEEERKNCPKTYIFQ